MRTQTLVLTVSEDSHAHELKYDAFESMSIPFWSTQLLLSNASYTHQYSSLRYFCSQSLNLSPFMSAQIDEKHEEEQEEE